MLDTLVAALSATGVGFASALIPVINAELVVLSFAVSASTPTVVVAAVAVAVGQTCGKLVIFECARRTLSGRRWSRLTRRSHTPQRPTQGWQARAIGLLESRGSGSAVVLASATTGLPPLLLVSAVAGAARMRRLDFAVCCLVGRSARFLLIGLGITAALPGLHL